MILNVADADTADGLSPRGASLYQCGYRNGRLKLGNVIRGSHHHRLLPEVVKAAKSMPEKAFIEKLNREHDQHLEAKTPIVMATPDEIEEFEAAIAIATLVEGCTTRAEAIRAISISYIQDHPVEQEEEAG